MGEMKRWLAIAVVTVAIGGGSVAAEAGPRIVLHVDDRARVPADQLAAAQALVAQIFAEAGVEVVWAEGRFPASISRPLGGRPVSRQLAVMLVNAGGPADLATGCTLGFAARDHALAYAFYNRIRDTAAIARVDPSLVLARVIAHEVGHVLLPPSSHSESGIMRANLDLGLSNPDRFTHAQSLVMRVAILNRSSSR